MRRFIRQSKCIEGSKLRRFIHQSKFPMVFFDGAAANYIGGAGICIWLNDHHHFDFKLGSGSNTNTRSGLLAL